MLLNLFIEHAARDLNQQAVRPTARATSEFVGSLPLEEPALRRPPAGRARCGFPATEYVFVDYV
eukprot:CAMPEP_0195126778 /NCGR_PEP_ID=MMETSP0448-20130528/135666_1 /TAXON_ID=66468 /ORGANISM="Heterocapsa triquestra, Strain CCMP 448" /LENGTH=63 /DNA_ID=CAMNT_0040164475 /DNA_START=38 /DNA_END=226 /DNA_ORIENTATION=-